jgi:hypothetical protein
MLHDLSRTIAMMGRLFLALARDRPAELALGSAIGVAVLLVFGVLAGFLRSRPRSP